MKITRIDYRLISIYFIGLVTFFSNFFCIQISAMHQQELMLKDTQEITINSLVRCIERYPAVSGIALCSVGAIVGGSFVKAISYWNSLESESKITVNIDSGPQVSVSLEDTNNEQQKVLTEIIQHQYEQLFCEYRLLHEFKSGISNQILFKGLHSAVTSDVSSIVKLSKNLNRVYIESLVGDLDVESPEQMISEQFKACSAVIVSPDNQWALVVCKDNTVSLINIKTGEKKYDFIGHTHDITSALFNRDGTAVLTSAFDNTTRIWNIDTGRQTGNNLKGSVFCEANSKVFNTDGKRVITIGNKRATVWDIVSSCEVYQLVGHTESITKAFFSDDSNYIATISKDKTARIWNAHTGELVYILSYSNEHIRSGVFSPNNNNIILVTQSGAHMWELVKGLHVVTFQDKSNKKNLNNLFSSVRFNKSGDKIITALFGDSDTAQVWDIIGNKLYSLKGHLNGVSYAEFNDDDSVIITKDGRGATYIWQSLKDIKDKLSLEQTSFLVSAYHTQLKKVPLNLDDSRLFKSRKIFESLNTINNRLQEIAKKLFMIKYTQKK